MAEGRDISSEIIGSLNVSSWQSGLTNAINQTYSYANNPLFYAMVPSFYRDYAWRYIRVACQWLDGYNPDIHNIASGIISTRIASRLITGLTKQIVGEKLVLRKNNVQDDNTVLTYMSKWAKQYDVIKAIFAGVGFSLSIGTCLVKANVNERGDIWWQSVRFDQCQYLASFANEVRDATFFIRSYVDTRNPNHTNQDDTKKIQFYLVEHRFYKIYDKPEMIRKLDGTIEVLHAKGEQVPMVEYAIKRVTGTMQNNQMPSNFDSQTLKWSEIPKDIKAMIKADFGSSFRVGEATPLPFKDGRIGVEALLNGEIDLSVPTGTNFGESMLVGIQDDLLTYEVATSYLLRDAYLGKGTIYLPKSMSMTDIASSAALASAFGSHNDSDGNPIPIVNPAAASPLEGFGEKKYEFMNGVDPEKQQAIVQQFEVRADQWQLMKENSLKNIAVKWGMSPKIIASFLTSGTAAQTATQVDSEDDACVAFIYHTRSYYKNAINRLLNTTLVYYGFPEDSLTIDFASPSLVNKDRLLNRVQSELEAGLTDIEDAIRTLNPDLDEEALQAKIQKAVAQQQAMMMSQVNEMNNDGTFEEEEEQANQGELVGAGPIN